jgi:leucyl aminopeptidase
VATINLSTRSAETARADALVVGIVKQGEDVGSVPGVGSAEDALRDRFRSLKATGERGEVTTVLSDGVVSAPIVAGVGLGERDDDGALDEEVLRRSAGAAVRVLGKYRQVAVALPATDLDEVRAVAEGALLGAYIYDRYLGTKRPKVGTVTVLTPIGRQSAARTTVQEAAAVATATNFARDLVNAPPNDLYPASFATAVRRESRGRSVRVSVLDETQLARQGYGGILGVGQGSTRPPRLMRMAYRPAGAAGHLAFVGKGITFDSGGYTIKPGPAMVTMKSDMAGAAAVMAATLAIAELGVPISVTAYACLAENMVSGGAVRPDDVITMFGGQTVEISNTDAEGRLVLADGIAAASGDKPDAIVDVATLTGHIVAAMGHRMGGVFANDETLSVDIVGAARRAGEQLCPLPIPDEMREKARASRIADLSQHHGERAGGTVFAAAFLREFVGAGIPWAHLDIAGPAFNDGSPHGYTPSGGTGMGVRTLVQLARERAG